VRAYSGIWGYASVGFRGKSPWSEGHGHSQAPEAESNVKTG